eukprot:TRINITY_DN5973_c0_g2_i2.p1 TRINITY_DN5973_c0_g2~~TRINITY_DN5973_c0_g2_i2.p1  ORF type:complete len:519 (+),score=122.51 TRINITY_DN5973_c0_g2_i2:66-1622(+)
MCIRDRSTWGYNRQMKDLYNNKLNFARKLGSPDKNERETTFDELKEFLRDETCSLDDYKKIWKALFYALWLADKVKFQQELSQRISGLLQDVAQRGPKTVVLWIEAALFILNREWAKIDRNRMNKFHYLIRTFNLDVYSILENDSWGEKSLKRWNKLVRQYILNDQDIHISEGLKLHFCQIFVDTLKSFSSLKVEGFLRLILPFVKYFAVTNNKGAQNVICLILKEDLLDAFNSNSFPKIKPGLIAKLLLKQAMRKEIEQANRDLLYEVYEKFAPLVGPEEGQDDAEIDQGDENAEEAAQPAEANPQKKKKAKKQKDDATAENGAQTSQKTNTKEKTKEKAKAQTAVPNSNLQKRKRDSQENKTSSQAVEEEVNEDIEEDVVNDEDWEEVDAVDDDEELYFNLGEDDGDGELNFGVDKDYLSIMKQMYPGLPEYFFQTPTERKKYFNKLNEEYQKKLRATKIVNNDKGSKHVKINVKRNEVFEFDKTEQTARKDQAQVERTRQKPKKGLLKRKQVKVK